MPKKQEKRRRKVFKRRPKFIAVKDSEIDYKNIDVLKKFLTERGKLLSRRLTGVSARAQRGLVKAIKRARYLGLLSSGSARKN